MRRQISFITTRYPPNNKPDLANFMKKSWRFWWAMKMQIFQMKMHDFLKSNPRFEKHKVLVLSSMHKIPITNEKHR